MFDEEKHVYATRSGCRLRSLNFDDDYDEELKTNDCNFPDSISQQYNFKNGMDGIDENTLEEIIKRQPSEWNIMKELLGINIFSYTLAALIAFFLGMNLWLGEGWLGTTIGIQGTGEFTEVSPSLPGSIDLNIPEFRL